MCDQQSKVYKGCCSLSLLKPGDDVMVIVINIEDMSDGVGLNISPFLNGVSHFSVGENGET